MKHTITIHSTIEVTAEFEGTKEEAIKHALEFARQQGSLEQNIFIDDESSFDDRHTVPEVLTLIYAGQSDKLKESKVLHVLNDVQAGVEHINFYDHQLENGMKSWNWQRSHLHELPQEGK